MKRRPQGSMVVMPAWVGRANGEQARSPFQELLHDLALAAMSVTHHDIDAKEPEAIHEMAAMERRFRPLVNSYLMASGRKSALQSPVVDHVHEFDGAKQGKSGEE